MIYLKKALYLIVLIGYSLSFAGSYEDFFSAVERNDAMQVKALLRRGFDPNSVNPKGDFALVQALRQSSFAVAQDLVAQASTNIEVRTKQDESPLMLAAIKGQLALCQQLIDRDADVNKPGWTPLHYAATGGNPAVVRLMLDHYAYVDAESPNGTTPLMMAARYGTSDAVKVLLDAGADRGLKNSLGLTALDFAREGRNQTSQALLENPTPVQRQDGEW